MRRFAFAVLLLSSVAQAKPAAPSPLNRQVAVAANTLGMQRYRSGELWGAAEQFRVAIDSDDSYVNAHYNLACVASRMGDTSTALKELSWLSDEPEPSDKGKQLGTASPQLLASLASLKRTKLSKAKNDPDLDFVSALPQAREKLGLPPFEKSRPSLWLSERGGVWSAELPAEGCEQRSYTLVFHDDGQVLLRVHEQCGDKLGDGEFHGSLQLTPVAVVIADWKAWPGQVPLSFAPCPGVEAAGACFVLAGTRSQLGPFHRGLPFPRDANHRQVAR